MTHITQTAQILVFGHEPFLLTSLALVLNRAGFGVETAVSKSETRLHIKKQTFDIVLMDLNQADFNNLSLLSEILSFSSKTRIVILTGSASTIHRRRAFRNGAAGYLVKPIHPSEIIACLHQTLRYPPARYRAESHSD